VLTPREKFLQQDLWTYDSVKRETKGLWKETFVYSEKDLIFTKNSRPQSLSKKREKLAARLKAHWLLCRTLMSHPQSPQTFLRADRSNPHAKTLGHDL
jgi:hypothetical protein